MKRVTAWTSTLVEIYTTNKCQQNPDKIKRRKYALPDMMCSSELLKHSIPCLSNLCIFEQSSLRARFYLPTHQSGSLNHI